MKRALLLGFAGLALVVPAVAHAHAALVKTVPSFRERVETAPNVVRLAFDESVTPLGSSIVVYSARGRVVSRPAHAAGPRAVEASLRRVGAGAYTVRWHVLSRDGHVGSGVYTFGVRVAAPPPTAAFGASGPTPTEHLVRWAYFLALALLLGGLSFRLLVLRGPLPAAVEQRFFLVAGVGAVSVVQVGVLAFILRAEDALQLPFGRLLYGDLSPIAGGTRFGTAFIAMTLGYALVTALVYLSWLTDRTELLWPAFLLGLGFASGLSLSGHSASSLGAELADWVHLSAAALWIGGLVQLALVVWPLAPELRRRAFAGFSRLATGSIAALLLAGIYLAIVRLPRVSDLWSTHYGHVLLVKISLVGCALAWGGVHHRVAGRQEVADTALGRLRRSLVGESLVGMAVLLVAAVLVDSKPPPNATGSVPNAASTRVRSKNSTGSGHLAVPGGRAREDAHGRDSAPLPPSRSPTARVTLVRHV